LDETEAKVVHERIATAIANGNGPQLEQAVYDLHTLIIYADHFPEQSFDFVLSMMRQRPFLEMEGSHHLIYIFEQAWAWDSLSENQRDRLMPALEAIYAEATDWMSWFVISSLLGDHFMNKQALETLRRLKSVEAQGPRSLVPHGFEHLVTSSGNAELARSAYQELIEMTNDPSEQVRKEAAISLQRIANQGQGKSPIAL
jgi:hypothetical protein